MKNQSELQAMRKDLLKHIVEMARAPIPLDHSDESLLTIFQLNQDYEVLYCIEQLSYTYRPYIKHMFNSEMFFSVLSGKLDI